MKPTPRQEQYIKFLMARTRIDKRTLKPHESKLRDAAQAALNEVFTVEGISRVIRDLAAAPIRDKSIKFSDFGPFVSEWDDQLKETEPTMLEKILRMYVMAMAGDVRSPLPHLVGPPGCGKSTAVEQAAELLNVRLHTLNVSRMSPLEIEGAQMPNHDNTALTQLTATWWSSLREGDIVLLDEFLRAFPEVYNGLLDILTSRKVGNFTLPKVFIIAASNSVTTYDLALEDRLLHLPVTDPRGNRREKTRLGMELIEHIGLLPDILNDFEMTNVLNTEVLPMYNVLDQFQGRGAKVVRQASATGSSVRKLIGQARLRMVESKELKELINVNNLKAMLQDKAQYVVLLDGKNPPPNYVKDATKLMGDPKLTELQATNLQLNLQLIEMAAARTETDEEREIDNDIFE